MAHDPFSSLMTSFLTSFKNMITPVPPALLRLVRERARRLGQDCQEVKTGGQQGDPLKMITFCLTIYHLWGRTLDKHIKDACAVAYADEGYIKVKLSVALEVLSDITELVLKEDDGLDINDKTKILVKGITVAEEHAAAQRLVNAHPSLAHLGPLLTPKAFVDNSYFGLGVPIGTDAFIQHL